MKTCTHLFHDATKRYLKNATDKTKQMKLETKTVDITDNVTIEGKLLRTIVVYEADITTTDTNDTKTDIWE